MSSPDELAARAIQDIRDLVELARTELAEAQGGELSLDSLQIISYWLARAWEAGRDYEIQRTAAANAARRNAFDG